MHWGLYHSWTTLYGQFGSYLPQIAYRPAQAHPYYPNTAHSVMLVMLMDGSVRGVSSSISAGTWNAVLIPDDGAVLGNDW